MQGKAQCLACGKRRMEGKVPPAAYPNLLPSKVQRNIYGILTTGNI
jgi:hypothetical protein